MDTKRLQELAGVQLNEADEKKEKTMLKCPLCDEEVEHGKLIKHIKDEHPEAREAVQAKQKDKDE